MHTPNTEGSWKLRGDDQENIFIDQSGKNYAVNNTSHNPDDAFVFHNYLCGPHVPEMEK